MKISAPLILALVSALPWSLAVEGAQSDEEDQLIASRLTSLSASNGGEPTDCGSTTMNRPDAKVTACAKAAFDAHNPFRVWYSSGVGFFKSGYGLARDAHGDVYQVEYDSRALLNLGVRKGSRVFDGNRTRVTTCLKPVSLANTQGGLLACVTPVNEQQSKLAAQQKPIDTTVCAILEHPSAFNNKLVRIHGYAHGNFEYSELGADGCPDALWFEYGSGDWPPGLVATIPGGARPGSEDAEGRLVLPVPVKLVQDTNFQHFQKLMMARAKAEKRDTKIEADTWTFYRVAATFIGRIDAVPDDIRAFHLKRKSMDSADFLGFGQMGLFDAQFVLRSVEGNAVLEKFPAIPNPVSPESR